MTFLIKFNWIRLFIFENILLFIIFRIVFIIFWFIYFLFDVFFFFLIIFNRLIRIFVFIERLLNIFELILNILFYRNTFLLLSPNLFFHFILIICHLTNFLILFKILIRLLVPHKFPWRWLIENWHLEIILCIRSQYIYIFLFLINFRDIPIKKILCCLLRLFVRIFFI